jgi:hypothetical protein
MKQFGWENVFLELQNKMPTFIYLLKNLVSQSKNRKPLICLIASQILKQQYPKLSIVLSLLLYGKETNKQVHNMSIPCDVWIV